MGIDQFIGTVCLALRQTGLRFGSCQRCLRLFQRGAIGSVIDREQYLAFFDLLTVGVIHFINVAGDARAELYAFHRFDPAIKAIPLANGFDDHISGADGGRLWRGILRDTLVAPDEQGGE